MGNPVVFFVCWFGFAVGEREALSSLGANSEFGRWLWVSYGKVVQECLQTFCKLGHRAVVMGLLCHWTWLCVLPSLFLLLEVDSLFKVQSHTKSSCSDLFYRGTYIFSTNHVPTSWRQYEMQTLLLRVLYILIPWTARGLYV